MNREASQENEHRTNTRLKNSLICLVLRDRIHILKFFYNEAKTKKCMKTPNNLYARLKTSL